MLTRGRGGERTRVFEHRPRPVSLTDRPPLAARLRLFLWRRQRAPTFAEEATNIQTRREASARRVRPRRGPGRAGPGTWAAPSRIPILTTSRERTALTPASGRASRTCGQPGHSNYHYAEWQTGRRSPDTAGRSGEAQVGSAGARQPHPRPDSTGGRPRRRRLAAIFGARSEKHANVASGASAAPAGRSPRDINPPADCLDSRPVS